MKIFKYPLELSVRNEIPMPRDAQILDIQAQNNELVMWALVNEKAPREYRYFAVYGTGQEIDDDKGAARYIATVQVTAYVWHIFEIPPYRALRNMKIEEPK